jgi:lysophospholipid acyltransferase
MKWNNDNSIINHTTLFMTVMMKITSFAFQVYDGNCNQKVKSQSQLKREINTLPSSIEFMGYILFFPAIFMGPLISYTEYNQMINQKVFLIYIEQRFRRFKV